MPVRLGIVLKGSPVGERPPFDVSVREDGIVPTALAVVSFPTWAQREATAAQGTAIPHRFIKRQGFVCNAFVGWLDRWKEIERCCFGCGPDR